MKKKWIGKRAKNIPVNDLFWEKVDIRSDNECWEWLAAKNRKTGIGMFYNMGSPMPAHKYSYILAFGETDEHRLYHTCKNNGCVNPNHIMTHEEYVKATFWDNVDVRGRNECWHWLKGASGEYGVSCYKGKTWRASRLSYLFEYGEFDLSLHVCHKCDNPICVNPSHLFLGTNADNVRDRDSKNRQWRPSGELSENATLTNDNVLFICREKDSYTVKELADMFDVSTVNIYNILNGKSWGSVTGIEYTQKRRSPLSRNEIEYIVDLYVNHNLKKAEIARMLDLSRSAVGNVINKQMRLS